MMWLRYPSGPDIWLVLVIDTAVASESAVRDAALQALLEAGPYARPRFGLKHDVSTIRDIRLTFGSL